MDERDIIADLERRLTESETRHRHLIDSWAQAVWETDATGVVVADSPSWRAYTGQTVDEWLGYGWLDAIHPDDRAYAERQWREAMAARSLVDAEFRLRVPNGGWRWTNVRAAPVRDRAGRIEKWTGMNIDIDARKRAEAALRESEERYRSLFNAVSQGLAINQLVRDGNGRVIDARYLDLNPAYEAQTDFERDKAIGHLASEIFPLVGPFWLEMAERVVATGQAERIERFNADTGRWFAFDMAPFEGTDQFVVIYDNITDRKQAEIVLRESKERQAFLLRLSDALRPLGDAGEIQATAARLLGAHLGVDRAMYAEVTGEPGAETGVIRGQFIRPAAPDRPAPAAFPDHFTYESFGTDVMARRYSGEGLVVADVDADTGFDATERAAWASAGIRAAIVAPLVKGNRLVAELGVHSETSRTWTDAEISLVREVGERTWAAAERAHAEAALREREARFRRAISVPKVGVLFFDLAGNMHEANAAFELMCGYTIEELRSTTHWDTLTLPEFHEATSHRARELAEQGETLPYEKEMIRKDGTRWWGLFAPTRLGGSGPASECVEFVIDITKTKRAEAALRRSEERLLNALSISTVGVLFWDGHDTLVETNEAFLRMTGLSRTEALGMSWRDLTPPEFLARSAAFVSEVRATGQGAPYEKQYFRKDGTRWWGLFAARKLDDGFVEFVLDVTDRRGAEVALRDSEERLRQFGEASSDVLWIREAETLQWTYLTPAFETIYGLDRETVLRGDNMTSWLDLIVPEDRQTALDSTQRVQAGERISFEYRIRRPSDNQVRWLRNTDFPMCDATGRVCWLGGVGRDITEEKASAHRQDVLVNELQHRARNLLGVVTAVVGRTLREGGSVDAFEERLQALSRAQGLLSQQGSDTVEVGALVRAELAAHVQDGSERVRVGGPEVQLTARQVQNFALALHELTTNAVKYGALRNDQGWLEVTWEVIRDRRGRPRLTLIWTEGGVAVRQQAVTRRGYGTELIREALAYALEADVEYELGSDGVRCRIEMPIGQPE